MNRKYLIWGGVGVVLAGLYFFNQSGLGIVNYPPQNNTVVAFGDSLVQGVGATAGKDFISLLSKKIKKPIINMGVSGETSGAGLARVEDVVAKNPGLVIILFGGNDYLRKVPKEETFQNLRQIITTLQSSGAMVVLLGVRGGILSDQFESSFEKLAEDTGSIYVLDVLSGLITNPQYMSDAIHPNNLGHQKIADKVYEEIKDYLK